MTSLNRTSASAADTGFKFELAVDDNARKIRLELSERGGLSEFVVPAIRAARWKRNFVGLVDRFRDRSAMMLAMIVTTFTSRLFRIRFAVLAKRSGLPLDLTFNFFKPCSENSHLFDKHVDNRLLLFKQRLAVGAIGRDLGNVHDPQILTDSARIHQDRFSPQ